MDERYARLHISADNAIEQQRHAADLRSAGHLSYLADDPDCPDVMRLAALVEEIGEIASCLHDGGSPDLLRAELEQAAGIAIAWASIL